MLDIDDLKLRFQNILTKLSNEDLDNWLDKYRQLSKPKEKIILYQKSNSLKITGFSSFGTLESVKETEGTYIHKCRLSVSNVNEPKELDETVLNQRKEDNNSIFNSVEHLLPFLLKFSTPTLTKEEIILRYGDNNIPKEERIKQIFDDCPDLNFISYIDKNGDVSYITKFSHKVEIMDTFNIHNV